jgi:nucleotide-binding universal stress UspA family protein
MTSDHSPVVVGLDGSAGADAALAWALEEARSRVVPARLVYGYGRDLAYGSMAIYGKLPVPKLSHIKTVAERLLADAATRAHELAPDVEVSTHLYGDDAVPVLLEESSRASSVVLGSRHLGAIGSAILGSVGAAVAARAACPVVVLRGPAELPGEHAALVVGVDALESSEATLAFGFEYASRRSVPLHAVLCWHLDVLAEMMWRSEPPAPTRVEAWLSEALAGWRETYPDVAVSSGVMREHPVAGLVSASSAQHMLVVGTRGRHALAGTLLGSVSQGVLHHATCPVAVVPPAGG